MILPLFSLLLAQASALPSLSHDRLVVCQAQARRDPTTAIATASSWLGEAVGTDRSDPQECLGFAYVSLLRWQAAEDAFLAAREALTPGDAAARARLAAMAGNAALGGARNEPALAHFEMAQAEATAAGDLALSGEIATDRARALVALNRLDEAKTALDIARRNAPQNVDGWLLSATLARRQGKLDDAQAQIATAAALAPKDPQVGLEAGVIAALAGHDDAARRIWRSVIEVAPDAPEAASARQYLDQLNPGPSGR